MNNGNSGNTSFNIPMAPLGYGGGYGNLGGFGGFGGDGWWIILLLLAFNGGWGGFGGGFGGLGGWGMMDGFPWLLASNQNAVNQTNDGFQHSSTQNQLSNIQTAINSGFSSAEVANCNRAMDAMQTAYNNEIASLNRSFAEQSANAQGFNNMQSQLASCCCENRLETLRTQNLISTDGATTRAAGTANTQAILDKLCQLELDNVKSDLAAAQRENATLQNQLNMATSRAENVAQTAALVADNNQQTATLIQRIAPYPIPSYQVSNPYGCGNNWWNGNNGFFGFNNGFNGPLGTF